MTRGASFARAALTAGAVVAVDQASKALVRADVEPGEKREILGEVLQLVHVRNDGIAFGALGGGGTVVAILVGVALIMVLALFVTHATRPLAWLPAGLLLGGAIGNVIDRIRLDAVTDFLKVPSWPAFNVADIAITLGAIVLVVVVGRDEADGRS